MKELIGPKEINELVCALAARIDRDCAGRPVVLIGVLKGAYIFISDLSRMIGSPVEVDFIRAASYGDACESSGRVCISRDIETDITGRDVILVEDIVDTGRTLDAIVRHIREKGPSSIRVCALLSKPSRRKIACTIDYVGMEVGDRFIVGYGLDHAERYRNLKGLFELPYPPPDPA